MSMFLFAIIILSGLNVFMYNHSVNLQQEITEEEQLFTSERATNATLKNKLYQTLDAKNLQTLIEEKGFIKIVKPYYLSLL